MFVVNEGLGTWDGSVINLGNPQRRDVQIVRAGGYLVLQFELDNVRETLSLVHFVAPDFPDMPYSRDS